MFSLTASFPCMPWRTDPMELRIDVQHPPSGVEDELVALYRRLHRPGDALYGLPAIDIASPGLIFRYREADGEHYVYVEDPARRCLAGCTVFNRLVELDRRADRHLHAPHSKYALAYQRRGIATAIYRWWLDGGRCLISGVRQSSGAHALWCSLARRNPMIAVDLRNKTLRHLAGQAVDRIHDDLHMRLLLLGKDWTVDGLKERAGML